jgi:hypothetical protein
MFCHIIPSLIPYIINAAIMLYLSDLPSLLDILSLIYFPCFYLSHYTLLLTLFFLLISLRDGGKPASHIHFHYFVNITNHYQLLSLWLIISLSTPHIFTLLLHLILDYKEEGFSHYLRCICVKFCWIRSIIGFRHIVSTTTSTQYNNEFQATWLHSQALMRMQSIAPRTLML